MLWNLCKTFTHTQEHGKDTHVFSLNVPDCYELQISCVAWIMMPCVFFSDFLKKLLLLMKQFCFTSLWSILSSLPIIPNIQTLLTHDQCLPTALMCDCERHMLSTQDRNGITPALRRKKSPGNSLHYLISHMLWQDIVIDTAVIWSDTTEPLCFMPHPQQMLRA